MMPQPLISGYIASALTSWLCTALVQELSHFSAIALPVPHRWTTIPPPTPRQHDADLISTGTCSMPGNTARGGIERRNNKQATHVSQY